MMTYEVEAWLGDDHGLTSEQVARLDQLADEIEERYPDPEETDEREDALIVAYRLIAEDEDEVLRSLGPASTTAELQQAALTLIPDRATLAEFARRMGAPQRVVRGWLGGADPPGQHVQ